jgi:hypothetical protein
LRLLDAADALIDHREGAGRPRHAYLRRAVSTAYYAVYHKLCLVTAETLLPEDSPETRLQLVRTFGHRETKGCCAWIAGRQGGVPSSLKPLVTQLRGTDMRHAARGFCDLQEARHKADYDHTATFPKGTARAYVDGARRHVEQIDALEAPDRQALATLLAMNATAYR